VRRSGRQGALADQTVLPGLELVLALVDLGGFCIEPLVDLLGFSVELLLEVAAEKKIEACALPHAGGTGQRPLLNSIALSLMHPRRPALRKPSPVRRVRARPASLRTISGFRDRRGLFPSSARKNNRFFCFLFLFFAPIFFFLVL
jgi:hypothetical protein